MDEFGLSLKDISSLSSDGRPCLNWEPAELFEVLQECCVPSLLDTVLTDALGLQRNALLCNNEACRRIILTEETVAREFVNFNKSKSEGISNQDRPHIGIQRVLWMNIGNDEYTSEIRKSTSQSWEGIESLQSCILKGFNAIEAASATI